MRGLRIAAEAQAGQETLPEVRGEVVTETHPVQNNDSPNCVPKVVTLLAYEVYEHVYGAQVAIIEGECRGGFSIGELIAFLYARNFPKQEWRQRMKEALNGMERRR